MILRLALPSSLEIDSLTPDAISCIASNVGLPANNSWSNTPSAERREIKLLPLSDPSLTV